MKYLKEVEINSPELNLVSPCFLSCPDLECVKLNVKSVGTGTFVDCPQLYKVEINGAEEIACCAFSDLPALNEVTLPDNLKYIGQDAFVNTDVTELTIPNSVEIIGILRDPYIKNGKLIDPLMLDRIGIADDDCIIKGYSNTEAEYFANSNGFKFVPIDVKYGDANCDGSVDMADAVLIMQALANPNKYGIDGTAEHHLTEQGKLNGDMDGDGLTVGDALAIQRKLLGLDSESIEIKPELGDIVSIKTPYRPAMSDWSGIGILLEFDSKDYSITLSTNEGHFTTWDIETGDGVVTNVGKTYDVGNSGYIFWTPDDLKYSDDFENEITVKGKNGDAQIELGKIYVTKDNQSNKSDLIASLERKRTMTLYDVKELAKKDGEFTWADFEAYSGRKCGTPFDMLAYIYEIDESYYLFVSGAVDGAPDQVQLCHYNEHISVDVLTGDVEAFIAEYSDYELPDIGYTFDEIYNMTEDEVRTVFNEKGLTDTEKYHVYPQRNGNTAVDNNSMTVLLYPENYMINLTDHELVTHVTNINDQDKLFKNSDIIWDREKVRKSLGLPKEYFYFEDVSSMGVTKSAPEGEDPDIRKYCQCSIRCTSEDKDKIADLRRAALNYIQLNPDFALVYPETYGG